VKSGPIRSCARRARARGKALPVAPARAWCRGRGGSVPEVLERLGIAVEEALFAEAPSDPLVRGLSERGLQVVKLLADERPEMAKALNRLALYIGPRYEVLAKCLKKLKAALSTGKPLVHALQKAIPWRSRRCPGSAPSPRATPTSGQGTDRAGETREGPAFHQLRERRLARALPRPAFGSRSRPSPFKIGSAAALSHGVGSGSPPRRASWSFSTCPGSTAGDSPGSTSSR